MKKNRTKQKLLLLIWMFIVLAGCTGEEVIIQEPISIEVNGLRFIGEAVIPSAQSVEGTTVGGLSSIDYADGVYYMISDDQGVDDNFSGPVRMYQADIRFDLEGIDQASITGVTEILNTDATSFTAQQVDPEALRFDPVTGHFVWASEGFANQSVHPFVRTFDMEGHYRNTLPLPNTFLSTTEGDKGPRHNAAFEGLAISADGAGYWVAMEGALKQDSDEARFNDSSSVARIAYVDRKTGVFGRQFAVALDAVQRLPAKPGFPFSVNGIVDILETQPNQFLVLERSFATNYQDGGNNVKLYKVDASNATDISSLDSLKNQSITLASKTELLDFESIRHQLTNQMVDNLEGMTFGPELENGNPSLVLVADDNFSAFSPQLNQILAFEVLETAPEKPSEVTINSVNYLDEFVLPPQEFEGTTVGGLSGIDYWNGIYYLISDDDYREDNINGPVRLYTADISFDDNGFKGGDFKDDALSGVAITGVIELIDRVDDEGQTIAFGERGADPEGVRIDPNSGNLIWINEGQIANGGVNPSVREIGTSGEYVRQMTIPAPFLMTPENPSVGPRNNMAFEGISINHERNGFWVAMEGPLKQDGEEASLAETQSPIRIALIDRQTGAFTRQFAYELDSVFPREGSENSFKVNGVVDILAYANDQFLVLERSFVAGQNDGGNDVTLYQVDASKATNIANIDALIGANYQVAEKTLLLNFNDIRDQLTQINGVSIVDNLEGMTFGPDLPNGNKSLVLVADNNFNAFGQQLNQFILLEIMP